MLLQPWKTSVLGSGSRSSTVPVVVFSRLMCVGSNTASVEPFGLTAPPTVRGVKYWMPARLIGVGTLPLMSGNGTFRIGSGLPISSTTTLRVSSLANTTATLVGPMKPNQYGVSGIFQRSTGSALPSSYTSKSPLYSCGTPLTNFADICNRCLLSGASLSDSVRSCPRNSPTGLPVIRSITLLGRSLAGAFSYGTPGNFDLTLIVRLAGSASRLLLRANGPLSEARIGSSKSKPAPKALP